MADWCVKFITRKFLIELSSQGVIYADCQFLMCWCQESYFIFSFWFSSLNIRLEWKKISSLTWPQSFDNSNHFSVRNIVFLTSHVKIRPHEFHVKVWLWQRNWVCSYRHHLNSTFFVLHHHNMSCISWAVCIVILNWKILSFFYLIDSQ